GADLEPVVDQVGRRQLVVLRVGGLVLTRVDGHLEHRVAEAAVAGAVQARREVEREDGARDRLRDRELRGNVLRDREIALAAELERRQLDLERLAMLLAGAELRLAQIEARHAPRVALSYW